MIFFDVTKTGSVTHRSGLTRVSSRLRDELGTAATPVAWDPRKRNFKGTAAPTARDWYLTSELFSTQERPGFAELLTHPPCRLAAIFHDAIPLKFPHTTWPQSVARHPGYMKLLSRFQRVWAVSEASRRELVEFWQWQGLERVPPVEVLPLGADFNGQPRVTGSGDANDRGNGPSHTRPRVLCLGILEPRKNQLFLFDVCAELWAEGLAFELHVVGRVNPHFGAPTLTRLKALQRKCPLAVHYHRAASDPALARLYAQARVTALPTLAEGCGLPLVESLWMGVPVLHSDLPALQENARDGGCLAVAPADRGAWKTALRRVLTDNALQARLAGEAAARPLARWSDAAQTLRQALG